MQNSATVNYCGGGGFLNNQGYSRNDYASPIKVHDLLPLFDRRDALLQERHAVIFGSLIIQDKLTQQTECFTNAWRCVSHFHLSAGNVCKGGETKYLAGDWPDLQSATFKWPNPTSPLPVGHVGNIPNFHTVCRCREVILGQQRLCENWGGSLFFPL